MLTMYDIFNKDTINIFTDGSIYNNLNTGETIGSAGAMILHCTDTEPIYINYATQVLRSTTNNETEIESVLLGLKLAADYINRVGNDYKINLFSDSKICVMGLREWIFNWIRCTYEGIVYNSSGSPVSNQEAFKSCISLILQYEMKINLYHQKGHVAKSEKSINNAVRVFKELNNGAIVDSQFIQVVSYYNNFVDIFTKNDLTTRTAAGEFNIAQESIKPPFILNPDSNIMDFKKYKQLIK